MGSSTFGEHQSFFAKVFVKIKNPQSASDNGDGTTSRLMVSSRRKEHAPRYRSQDFLGADGQFDPCRAFQTKISGGSSLEKDTISPFEPMNVRPTGAGRTRRQSLSMSGRLTPCVSPSRPAIRHRLEDLGVTCGLCSRGESG